MNVSGCQEADLTSLIETSWSFVSPWQGILCGGYATDSLLGGGGGVI